MGQTRYDTDGLVRMDEQDCWSFLRAHGLGRIVVVQYDRPLVFPVNYTTDGESIVFRTARGSKLTAAGRGSVAAFEVDDVDESLETGASVVVHGALHEISAPYEHELAGALDVSPWAPGDRSHLVRVTAHWVTGRRIPSASAATP